MADLILLPESSRPQPVFQTATQRRKKCVYKEMELKHSLFESVVHQHSVVSIPDVRQHVSEQSAGLIELLFAVDTQPPRSMLLLPLFTSAGTVCGGVYIMSFLMGNLVSIQHEVESLLMVASETITKTMNSSATPSAF